VRAIHKIATANKQIIQGGNYELENEQYAAPLYEAVLQYVNDGVVPFHVPGHKQGRGLPELADMVGEQILQMDVNGMKDLDFIGNPQGVIREAQILMAKAFHARRAYFLVNGTTSGVQAMIMAACEPGSEIIVPRNAHKSTFGGIILSGAIPIYVQPQCDRHLGITTGVALSDLETVIKAHPHAQAVLVINPSYYGIATDLKAIVNLAHSYNMAVLVDEAHGAHAYFHPAFPVTAMEAGADMSAASMHKTSGSLTQSSVLLYQSNLIPLERVKKVLDLTYTSSASYLLMTSLDLARRQMTLKGKKLLSETLRLVRWAREEINRIPGLFAFGPNMVGKPGCYAFDETKLGIHVAGLGLIGYQVEEILRHRFNIQVEMSDLHNILAIITIGDRESQLRQLTSALQQLAAEADHQKTPFYFEIPPSPEMIVSPRDAFYSPTKSISLKCAAGEIAAEMLMAYPPGIPVILPGERISADMIEYIRFLKSQGCTLQGTADPQVNCFRVLGSE